MPNTIGTLKAGLVTKYTVFQSHWPATPRTIYIEDKAARQYAITLSDAASNKKAPKS